MKALLTGSIFVLLTAACIVAQSPGAAQPRPVIRSTRLHITVAVDPPIAKLGERINLKIQLKNISEKPLRVLSTDIYGDYRLYVLDASGKEPPRTKFGEAALLPPDVLLRSVTYKIEPGEEIPEALEITRVYQLTQPGSYSTAVVHGVKPDTLEESRAAIEKAFSNEVKFTITK